MFIKYNFVGVRCMIKSIQKATKLLSILADNYEQPVPLSELSAKTNINKSTCSHIISTLESEGYATKISHSKGYILGPAAYSLSRFGKYKSQLSEVCKPIMQYLYCHSGYSVVLAIIEGGTKYLIDYIDDGRIFETKEKIKPDDIYRTATGRAILANLNSEKLDEIIQKYGYPTSEEWPEISSCGNLLKYISKIKKGSVFKSRICHKNNTVNLGYGAAIFNNIGCVGAIGVAVSIPSAEETSFEEEEKKIIKLLERGALEINRLLSS